jgi:hypothetical protein
MEDLIADTSKMSTEEYNLLFARAMRDLGWHHESDDSPLERVYDCQPCDDSNIADCDLSFMCPTCPKPTDKVWKPLTYSEAMSILQDIVEVAEHEDQYGDIGKLLKGIRRQRT